MSIFKFVNFYNFNKDTTRWIYQKFYIGAIFGGMGLRATVFGLKNRTQNTVP